MSWLLAVSVPGMLMFSTIALQRLEGRLHREVPCPARLAAVRIEQAAQAAVVRARATPVSEWHGEEPTLPTKLCSAAMTNRRFQPSGFANSV